MQDQKLLVLLIILKRYRNNSVILKTAKYKLAAKFSMSPVTFNKYLDECIRLGYIIDRGDRYQIIQFKELVVSFAKNTGTFFGKHQILCSKNLSFKSTLAELQRYLVIDNIINPQENQLKRKKTDIELINFANRTVKSDSFLCKHELKRLKKLHKEGKLSACAAKKVVSSYTGVVITSARHTAKKLKVSVQKANSILNSGESLYSRNILVKWVKGVSFFKIESLRIQYPDATIIPLLNYDVIKICFGSSLSHGNLKSL